MKEDEQYEENKGGVTMTTAVKLCEKHKTPMTPADCPRCSGNGFTMTDIELMNDPLEFHNDGNCWQCKGTGICGTWCEDCEQEAIEEYESEF